MNQLLLSLLLVLGINLYGNQPFLTTRVVQNPKLFEKYPTAIHFKSILINDLIARKKNESVSVTCSENFAFKGVIIQNIQWNKEAQTIALKLDSFPEGTSLVINRIVKDDKIIFKGHIMNVRYQDAYQLSSYGDAEFVFNKISRENIVTE